MVRRRLKTVLGLGTGFTTVLLLDSDSANMAARFGAELFLNASKSTVDFLSVTERLRSRGASAVSASVLWMWTTSRRILFLCPVAVTPRLMRASWSRCVRSLADRRPAPQKVSRYLQRHHVRQRLSPQDWVWTTVRSSCSIRPSFGFSCQSSVCALHHDDEEDGPHLSR